MTNSPLELAIGTARQQMELAASYGVSCATIDLTSANIILDAVTALRQPDPTRDTRAALEAACKEWAAMVASTVAAHSVVDAMSVSDAGSPPFERCRIDTLTAALAHGRELGLDKLKARAELEEQ